MKPHKRQHGRFGSIGTSASSRRSRGILFISAPNTARQQSRVSQVVIADEIDADNRFAIERRDTSVKLRHDSSFALVVASPNAAEHAPPIVSSLSPSHISRFLRVEQTGQYVPPSTEDHLQRSSCASVERPKDRPPDSSVELTMDEWSNIIRPPMDLPELHRMACLISGPQTASSEIFVCKVRTQSYSMRELHSFGTVRRKVAG